MENIKKEYNKPIIDFIIIDDKDVVTASYGTDMAGDEEESFGNLLP